jgi:hypothetical protein
MVRPKTVERTSYKLETVETPVTVKYYENEAFKVKVTTPRRVQRQVPYEVKVRTPRVVHSPVVLSYSDPYSATSLWSSPVVSSSVESVPAASEKVTYGASKPVTEQPPASSVLESSPSDNSPRSSQKPEVVEPPQAEEVQATAPANEGSGNQGSTEIELNSSSGAN